MQIFRWKVTLWGENRRVWLCQACRDLPARELRERIEWNHGRGGILPKEPLILTETWLPTEEDRAECRRVANSARFVLALIDAGELDEAQALLAVLSGEEESDGNGE